jgi:hypothetical protein
MDLSSQPTPLQTVYNWFRDGQLYVNRNYQRKLVWTLEEKQKLIDSILRDYPIPLVLLSEQKSADGHVFEILDGMQRIHTVVSFIEHGFSTSDGRYFNVDEFTRAKDVNERGLFSRTSDAKLISRAEVAKILDYILPVSVIRHASEAEVTDVFSRINTYGHRLSDQERRQAGLSTPFAKFVRSLSTELRGDVSVERLPLYKMPEISIDLPKTKYGYLLQAGDIFWVKHGILRSTELRDSVDEQVVADICACILSEDLVERSKDALDNIYADSSSESDKINLELNRTGPSVIADKFKYCVQVLETIVSSNPKSSLRDIIFNKPTSNSFPTIFSAILIAIYEISFQDGLVLANPLGAKAALTGVQSNLNTNRTALSIDERRRNINVIKGLIRDKFAVGDVSALALGQNFKIDLENLIRRSQLETPRFELKQGMLNLDNQRNRNNAVLVKIAETAVAMANAAHTGTGTILIGVADKEADAIRIEALDKITPQRIGERWIVGIDREANILGLTVEKYFHIWRDFFKISDISSQLKTGILSSMDCAQFDDMHVLMIKIPKMKEVSFYKQRAYLRKGDETVEATQPELLALAKSFG